MAVCNNICSPNNDHQGSDISEGLWPSSADQLHSGGVQDGYQEGLSGMERSLTGQSKTCHDEGSSLNDDGVSFDDEGKSLDDERVSIDDGKSLDDTEQSLEMEPVDLHKVDKVSQNSRCNRYLRTLPPTA